METTDPYREFKRLLDNTPANGNLPYSFLDLYGLTYNENAISNLYAYFFDPNEDHGLGQTFLKCLGELIDLNLQIADFKVHREHPTPKGGRIDIVLKEETKESRPRVIVIENKVYHTVDNDLNDYLQAFPGYIVTGVLLAPVEINVHSNFRPVTHSALLESVSHSLGSWLISAPPKYLLILQDFIYHMKYLDAKMENKAYEFMFEEGTNIEKLNELRDNVFFDLVTQIKRAGISLGWVHNRTSGWSQSMRSVKGGYLMYFQLTNIFPKHEFEVQLYISGKSNVRKWMERDYNRSTKNKAKSLGIELVPDSDGGLQPLTASKKYKVQTVAELIAFDQLIKDVVTQDWQPLCDALTADFGVI